MAIITPPVTTALTTEQLVRERQKNFVFGAAAGAVAMFVILKVLRR